MCTHRIYYLDAQIALEGYDTAVFDSMYHIVFDKNNDTIIRQASMAVVGYDTAGGKYYLNTNENGVAKAPIGAGDHHLITINTDSFWIKDILIGPTEDTVFMEGRCSPGAGMARCSAFLQLNLNGNIVRPISRGNPIYYILLKKP